MKAILGPYPPRFGGAEWRAKQEFENGSNLFIGTSHSPKSGKNLILIKKRRFPVDCPLLLIKIWQNQKKIDSINAHYATTFGYIARLAKLLFRIPYTVTCHGTDVLLNLNHPVHRFFTMSAIKHADSIIVVSKKLKQKLIAEHFPAEKIKIEIAEIDRRQFKKINVKKQDRIIFVGKVQRTKGVDLLINAFSKVAGKFPEYKLTIAGNVSELSYYKELKKLIKDLNLENRIEFLGDRTDIPKLLNSSKLFVMPSRSEGWGIALAEALACGLPCIATRVGGIPEVLEKYKGDCTLIEPKVGELAKAIEKKLRK